MSRFNKNVTKKLQQAGWYSGRRVNISPKLKLMTEAGYTISDSMTNFLLEFDGLSLTYSNGDNPFDLITYIVDFHTVQCAIRSALIDENAIPVGSFSNSNFLIIISDDNKMYCYDEFENVYKIGDYYDEGIEFICTHGLNPRKYLKNKIV